MNSFTAAWNSDEIDGIKGFCNLAPRKAQGTASLCAELSAEDWEASSAAPGEKAGSDTGQSSSWTEMVF